MIENEELEKRIDEASMYLREWIKSEESDTRTRMIALLENELKEYNDRSNNPITKEQVTKALNFIYNCK